MRTYAISTRRRAVLLLVAVVAIVGVFVVRLVDVQMLRADALVAESLTKTVGSQTIEAERGSIVDTDGTVLAESVTRFNLTTSPVDVGDFQRTGDDGEPVEVTVDEALEEIAEIAGTDAGDMRGRIDDALENDPDSNYAQLASGLDAEARLSLPSLGIPWLYYETDAERVYPNGSVAGNVLGFVTGGGETMSGMEAMQDSCLAGTPGLETYQRTQDGVALPGTTEVLDDPVEGGSLRLTIDADLNWYMQQLAASQVEATGAEYGIVMVTEAKTGKVRAVAETTAVDPNDPGATESEYRGSLAFQNMFEPGSVFKALTAASLVDAGVADHTSRVVAEYWYNADNGARIRDALPHDPYNLTLTGVLQESSNTGTAILGERLDAQSRHDYLEKFGIGAATGIGFPAETAGNMLPADQWFGQTYYTPMFGQGVGVSAAQLSGAYQALANDGVRLPLQLVEGCEHEGDDDRDDEADAPEGTRVVSAEAASETRKMMETVVTDGFLADELEMPGYRVAAKSGTGEQFDGDGNLQSTFMASMAGMVPADDPEYVVTVHLKDPRTLLSSAAAAPVFKQAVTQVIKHYGIPPSTTPGSDYPGRF